MFYFSRNTCTVLVLLYSVKLVCHFFLQFRQSKIIRNAIDSSGLDIRIQTSERSLKYRDQQLLSRNVWGSFSAQKLTYDRPNLGFWGINSDSHDRKPTRIRLDFYFSGQIWNFLPRKSTRIWPDSGLIRIIMPENLLESHPKAFKNSKKSRTKKRCLSTKKTMSSISSGINFKFKNSKTTSNTILAR